MVDDGSKTEGVKLGAIGAIRPILDDVRDDLLILAGDCLFLDDLGGLLDLYGAVGAPVTGLYRPASDDQMLRGSAARIDQRGVISSFVERPKTAVASLVGAVMYALPARIRERFNQYAETGRSMDAPGRFIEWLVSKETVYGYPPKHHVWGIGTPEAYERAGAYLRGEI